MLTPRQALLLGKVVDGFAQTGQPVGSKTLASDPDVPAGPSTIRNELAVLEENGLLAHPHTSAGRVPTDAGYRYYVDCLLPEAPAAELRLSLVRREVDEAMRMTTETLSQVTNLLAIVSAPPIGTTTIRHIEVLLLQPQVLMVVVITSTGGVSKKVFTFDRPVDSGLAELGRLVSERAARRHGPGRADAALQARRPVADRGRAGVRRPSSRRRSPSWRRRPRTRCTSTARTGCVSEYRFQDVSQLNALMEMLERRVSMLGVLSAALDTRSSYVRIGGENPQPALQSLSLVAANYGLPQRNLGTVSVIGPTRMDYARAIRSVREAAHELSRFIEELY